jgi:PAS domain-containing protein
MLGEDAKVIWRLIARNLARQRAQSEMRWQPDLLQKTFDSMTDAIFLLEAKLPVASIIECNQGASVVFGYDRTEMLGRTINFLHVSAETLKDLLHVSAKTFNLKICEGCKTS